MIAPMEILQIFTETIFWCV